MVHITVPVTSGLRDRLLKTAEHLKAIEEAPDGRLNDREYLRTTVSQLERLVVAVLEATAVAPMTGPKTPGARFHTGNGQSLDLCVASAISYLRDEAAEVLQAPQASLSAYSTDRLGRALTFLRQLNGLLLSSIIRNAERDLAAIRGVGTGALLNVAGALAEAARTHS